MRRTITDKIDVTFDEVTVDNYHIISKQFHEECEVEAKKTGESRHAFLTGKYSSWITTLFLELAKANDKIKWLQS